MLSIIVPVKDNKEITQTCLDSLKQYTKSEHEIIVIDDGSKDDTRDFIRSYHGVTLIRNEQSLGWCKAINQGLEVSRGEYVLFSNNDVVATPGWDEKMIGCFLRDPSVGVVGPTTNKVDGFQSVDFNKPESQFQYTDVLTFFFVMVKRAVIDSIGGLDDRFGLGGQDDADYCIRARKAGFKVGIARDVFIYHYGSATFRNIFENNGDIASQYAKSRVDILRDKHRGSVDPGVRKRIFLAVPNGGSLVVDLVNTIMRWTHDPRWTIRTFMPSGIFPLDAARNKCVKEFLETDCDYILWIDDDIVPPLDGLEKLLKADKDIIGAACFAMKYQDNKAFPYPVTLRYNEEKKYVVYYGQGVEEVDATGGAFLLVKREVYEKMERPYEFIYHRDGTLALTCDFRVWQKAQELGYKLFIDFSVLCSHFKKVDLKKYQDMLLEAKNG